MKTLLLLSLLVSMGAAAQPLGADLPSLLAHARRSNPELAAMQRESDAAAERVLPAGALPDPLLRVEFESLNKARAERETKYTLMQPLPAFGKRDAKRSAAEADVRQAQARAAATWAEQAMRIKTAYAQFFQAVRSERITQEVLDLVGRMEQVAQVRYAGGLAPQQDAIRAQLEQTAMRAELVGIASEKRQLRARLNGLLAREPAAAMAEPQLLPALPAALSWDDLVARARSVNPLARAEAARLDAAEANRQLTWRNRYPDFSVGVSPTQMGSRIAGWAVMVEVMLPLQQSARRSQESEALAMLAAARARSEAVANQLGAELEEQLSAMEAARRTEALVQGQQLPQSELVLKSALAAYENGKVDFAAVLDAQRQIRKARLDLLKAQVEARMRLAEIERTVGEDL
ncbi:MAG: TolC family protein [Burkholderiales bacterium]|nr:TolC family protein [Burkholderiales bacterium]